MPVFVISVRPAETLAAHLHALLGEAPAIVGVDGKQMAATQYFAHNLEALRHRRRPLAPGETGCALAHVEAYRRLAESGAPGALIFEDDVILSPALARLDTRAFAGRFDVVLLGCMQGLPGRMRVRGKRAGETHAGLPPLYAVPRRYSRYLLRSAAYWISRAAAARLRERQLACLRKADDWRDWARQLDLRMGFMDLCAHPLDLSGSLLEDERQALSRRRSPPRQKQWRLRFVGDWLVERWHGLEPCGIATGDKPAMSAAPSHRATVW
ncbi:glycosyltransferase family 25 protein [Solimonas soli]|uniref:glycosyltransferase family 25 protein n=1 Tax=Solimonas soli TaxID=413479 RepID=UPI000482439A|nr:glycosyltransferase family 25 protein [Solimonas soli]